MHLSDTKQKETMKDNLFDHRVIKGNHTKICPHRYVAVPVNMVFPPTNYIGEVVGNITTPVITEVDVMKGKKFVEENKK